MDRAQTTAGGLSPIKVFVTLGALLLAGTVALVLLQEQAPPIAQTTPRPTTETPDTPTRAEAFESLTNLRIAAYENLDVSRLDAFLSSDSPLRAIIRNEIKLLIRRDLSLQASYQTVKLVPLSESPDRVVLKQIVLQDIRIRSALGDEVGQKEGLFRRVIRWTLVNEGSGWRIHNSKLINESRA